MLLNPEAFPRRQKVRDQAVNICEVVRFFFIGALFPYQQLRSGHGAVT